MRNNFSRQVKESFSLGLEESMRLEISSLKTALEMGAKNKPEHGMSSNMKVIQIKNFFQKHKFPLNEEAEQIVRGMIVEARESGNTSIDTEHMLLSILRNNNTGAYSILSQLGLDYHKARTNLKKKIRD